MYFCRTTFTVEVVLLNPGTCTWASRRLLAALSADMPPSSTQSLAKRTLISTQNAMYVRAANGAAAAAEMDVGDM